MAITANRNSSGVSVRWGLSRLANCASTPISAISTRDRKRPGPGRPKTYDGKVHWDDLSRFEKVETDDDDIVLYHQVLNHVQFQCNLRVVLVVDTKHHRRAVLFSTDVALDALTLYRYYKARFQIEFLFRDAKQFTGLTDCQARSQAKLHFHFNASLSAVTLAKLDARQHTRGGSVSIFHGEPQAARL